MKQNSKKSKWKILYVISGIMLGITCGILKFIKKKDAQDEDLKKNLYEGAGEPTGSSQKSIYEAYIKRGLDIILALLALIPLTPALLVVSLLIFIDDPGPVIFTQKRVGINKTYFKLYKFRSMKMSTPHDVPTHQLENPEQYITRVGRFLRKSSLEGNDIIRQTTKSLINKGFREVSPIPFFNGCNLISNDFRVMIA